MKPRPAALRLHTQATGKRPPAPPFGLPGWDERAAGVAVWLDAARGIDDAAAVAAQLPEAGSLEAGAAIVVLGHAARAGGGLSRWLGPREVAVARSARCTALLARGYVDIAADGDLVWGRVPPAR